MANEKISQMPAISSFATGDLLPIVDVSEISASDKNKSVTFGELFRNVLGGSASAPSIAFTGDQNTGVYSPGADQVAISTGGSGRLFVDASGNIGVGAAPSAVTFGGLDVRSGGLGLVLGADSGAATRTDATTKLGRYLSPHYLNAEEPVAALIASNDSTESIVSIGGGTSLANAATTVRFFTAANNTTTSGTERLRITSAGLVGIGASAPQDTLQVGADSTSHIAIANTGSTDVTSGIRWRYGSAGTVLSQILSAATGVGSNTYLSFHTSGTGERMRIDAIGRVGIGVTAPIAQTHIRLSAVTGYTSPSNDGLVIERGGGNDVGISIATDNTRNGYLIFADGDSANPAWVGYDHSANAMSFRVNA